MEGEGEASGVLLSPTLCGTMVNETLALRFPLEGSGFELRLNQSWKLITISTKQ